MIGFERPEALLACLVVGPLLWWWHRRQRRPRAARVSSLLIWERAGVATETTARQQPAWLLLLEVAAALALILAAAGPYRALRTSDLSWLTVLVDRRPGMGAVDREGRSRLARARDALREHLNTYPAGTKVRLLTVPPAPGGTPVFTLGTAAAATELDRLAVATLSADFDAAVADLESHGGRRLVVTDEPLPAEGNRPGAVAWLSVGAPGCNVGLIWARVVRSKDGARQLSVGVMNGGTEAAVARVALQPRDRRPDAVSVPLAPGEVRALPAFDLEGGPAGRSARVVLQAGDALAADDVILIRPTTRGAVSLVAAEPVPPAVHAALAALGSGVVELGAGDAAPAAPALYWKVTPPAGARPPWVWVGCEGIAAGLRLGPGYRPTAVVAAPDAVTVGGVETIPRRVVRALRVAAEPPGLEPPGSKTAGSKTAGLETAGWRVQLHGLDPSGRRVPLVLARADGATVLAFDPLHDAPGWSSEPSFPAFFYAALGRATVGVAVEGLLSPADTRLGATAASPPASSPPSPSPVVAAGEQQESLAVWLLLAAALALVGICLLEV